MPVASTTSTATAPTKPSHRSEGIKAPTSKRVNLGHIKAEALTKSAQRHGATADRITTPLKSVGLAPRARQPDRHVNSYRNMNGVCGHEVLDHIKAACPAVPPPAGRCVFWSLPYELRDIVYEMLYPSMDATASVRPTTKGWKLILAIRKEDPWRPTALLGRLLVSKQYFCEAARSLYSRSTFSFDNGLVLHTFLLNIGGSIASSLREVSVGPVYRVEPTLAMLVASCPNLRKLTLCIAGDFSRLRTEYSGAPQATATRLSGICIWQKAEIDGLQVFLPLLGLSELTQFKIEAEVCWECKEGLEMGCSVEKFKASVARYVLGTMSKCGAR